MNKPWPAVFQWEILADHWHCTPGQAREQSEVDIALAHVRIDAENEIKRRQEAFGHA